MDLLHLTFTFSFHCYPFPLAGTLILLYNNPIFFSCFSFSLFYSHSLSHVTRPSLFFLSSCIILRSHLSMLASQSRQNTRPSLLSSELAPLPPHPQASVAPPFGSKGWGWKSLKTPRLYGRQLCV